MTSNRELIERLRTEADDLAALGAKYSFNIDTAVMRQAAAALSALEGEGEKPVWRCFHCDEVFTTPETAREHFGTYCDCTAGCQIDLAEYRRMEDIHQRHLVEDSDADREFYALRAAHSTALIREEEKGYERGLRDGRAHPAPLTPDERGEVVRTLRPFVEEHDEIAQAEHDAGVRTPDDMNVDQASIAGTNINMGHLRAAKAIMDKLEGKG